MKQIVLQTVNDEKLFSDLNNITLKSTTSIIYYQLPEFNYDQKFLVYTQDDKMLFLCEKLEDVPVIKLNDNYSKIGRRKVFGTYLDKTFYKFKVLSKIKLQRRIHFPESDKTYYLNKPIHERIHSELIMLTADHLEINNYLSDEEAHDEGCIPYKINDKWGFLFYKLTDEGNYEFTFEMVNNVRGKKRLVQTDEGYKDFTYFIKSQALPKAYKIGRAENPDDRLKTIQAHNARDTVADLILADGRLESYFHNRFDHLRISDTREWFEIGDDLIEYILKESKKVDRIRSIFEKSSYKKEIQKQFK